MTRHIVDHREPSTGARTRAFWAMAHKDAPHPAVIALIRQPRPPRKADKTVQFLRIDRGRTA